MVQKFLRRSFVAANSREKVKIVLILQAGTDLSIIRVDPCASVSVCWGWFCLLPVPDFAQVVLKIVIAGISQSIYFF